jgi:SAM-dependent methyltransferase
MNSTIPSIPARLGDNRGQVLETLKICYPERNAPQTPNPPIQRNDNFFRELIIKEYRRRILPGHRVLEVGCGHGHLLSAVQPSAGLGIDSCPKAIEAARELYPHLSFRVAEPAYVPDLWHFDYIILSNVVNDLFDVQLVFEGLHAAAHPRTRLILHLTNPIWQTIHNVARRFSGIQARPKRNCLSQSGVADLLAISGWEVINQDARILWPFKTPVLDSFCNRLLAPFARPICYAEFVVARQRPCYALYARGHRPVYQPQKPRIARFATSRLPRCSVVVPVRNERDNIEPTVQRIPEMEPETEIILVEGGSTDGTWKEVQRVLQVYSRRKIRAIQQRSVGKAGAVREGFAAADGDILLILDSDLTVSPEDLHKFYRLLVSGEAEFVNGVRLAYPMEDKAMRFLNKAANKLFARAISERSVLCGNAAADRDDTALHFVIKNCWFFGLGFRDVDDGGRSWGRRIGKGDGRHGR